MLWWFHIHGNCKMLRDSFATGLLQCKLKGIQDASLAWVSELDFQHWGTCHFPGPAFLRPQFACMHQAYISTVQLSLGPGSGQLKGSDLQIGEESKGPTAWNQILLLSAAARNLFANELIHPLLSEDLAFEVR